MSELLEPLLELLLNFVGCVVEALAEIWLGDLNWPDTRGGRVFLCVVIVLLGGVICWELR